MSQADRQRSKQIKDGFAAYFDAPGVGLPSRVGAVERLLGTAMKLGTESKEVLRRRIVGHAEFGDPRLRRKGPAWAQASDGARRRMLTLLVGRDLRFFFDTIVREDPLAQRRRDFWLRYEAQVESYNVALCSTDVAIVSAGRTEKPFFSNLLDTDYSAFMIRFGGESPFVAVEFSAHGNAAYIYKGARFDAMVGDMHRPEFRLHRHLKVRDKAADRWLHKDAAGCLWEQKFATDLARRGIRP